MHSATHSKKNSVEANIGGSSTKVLTKHVVLLVGKLAPGPGIFATLDLHGWMCC